MVVVGKVWRVVEEVGGWLKRWRGWLGRCGGWLRKWGGG